MGHLININKIYHKQINEKKYKRDKYGAHEKRFNIGEKDCLQ